MINFKNENGKIYISINDLIKEFNKYRKLVRTGDKKAKKEYTRQSFNASFYFIENTRKKSRISVDDIIKKINILASRTFKNSRYIYARNGYSYIYARILLDNNLTTKDKFVDNKIVRVNAFIDTNVYDRIFAKDKTDKVSTKAFNKEERIKIREEKTIDKTEDIIENNNKEIPRPIFKTTFEEDFQAELNTMNKQLKSENQEIDFTKISLKEINKAYSEKRERLKEEKNYYLDKISKIEAKEKELLEKQKEVERISSKIKELAKEYKVVNSEKVKLYKEIESLGLAS